LQIRATVRITDHDGRRFETITPDAMRHATRVTEMHVRWTWTVEIHPNNGSFDERVSGTALRSASPPGLNAGASPRREVKSRCLDRCRSSRSVYAFLLCGPPERIRRVMGGTFYSECSACPRRARRRISLPCLDQG
jgi:hypothetical protein